MVIKKVNYSNIISPKNFILLSVLSFGVYQYLWFYRNWTYFEEKEKMDIYPLFRVLLAIFFAYQFFKKVLISAKKKGYKQYYSPVLIAVLWILFVLIGRFNFRSNDNTNTYFIIFFIALFQIAFLLPVLRALNFYYSKVEKHCVKRSLEWWHILFIIFFLLLWVVLLLSLFLVYVL